MSGQPATRVPDEELDYDEDLTYRWHGKLFTGIAYEHTDAGLSEVSYSYGTQAGPTRDWYPSGTLKSEVNYQENVLHGSAREYAEDGSLTKESLYEYGILVCSRERQDGRDLVTTFMISSTDDTLALLERYRREKGWPLPE
jgi:antitoxin component YwqK of YwqJK toxin-antitoxin module